MNRLSATLPVKRLISTVLSILLVAAFYFGFDSRGALSDRNHVIGEPVTEGIIAVHNFSVPYSEIELEEMGREVEASVPIYLMRDEQKGQNSSEEIQRLIFIGTGRTELAQYFGQRVSSLYSTGIIDIEALRLIYQGSRAITDNGSAENISELFTLAEARDGIRLDLERREFPADKIPQILEAIVPDLEVDSAGRVMAVEARLSDLPSIKREFMTGEEILPPGGLFTEEISRSWDAMVISPDSNQGGIEHNIAKTGLVSLLILLAFLYLWKEQNSFSFSLSSILLLFTVWGIAFTLTVVMTRLKVPELSVFSFTMLGASLTSVFFDRHTLKKTVNFTWFLTAVFSAIFALASPHPMATFFMGFIPASLVSIAIRDLKDSGTSTAMLVGMISSVLVYWLLAVAGSSGSMNFNSKVWFALLGIPLVVTGTVRVIVHPLEILFGVSTALTYRRLGNESHPLRQQLQREARGTSNHSRLVADLASDAAVALGLDDTLANLGGLYHDIGKLTAPGMFIENISNPDENNPHLNMPPVESAKVILAHVDDGVELARKHNLPSDLIDIIEQHHGDTSARFFMEKARRELPPGGELDESVFHYNGQRPQSIEAALIMLADSTSSAVKGLGAEASAEQKAAVISRIIQEKADDGQFDDCKLTGPMRTRVAHVFIDQLCKKDERVKDYPHGN